MNRIAILTAAGVGLTIILGACLVSAIATAIQAFAPFLIVVGVAVGIVIGRMTRLPVGKWALLAVLVWVLLNIHTILNALSRGASFVNLWMR